MDFYSSASLGVFLWSALMFLMPPIFTIIISFIAIKVSSKLIHSFFGKSLATSKSLDANKAATLSSLLSSVIRYAIVFVALCTILINFGVPASTLTAVLGTGTVAIGLATQSIIKDAITGFLILLENQFSVGDIVSIDNRIGTIEDITIRTTLLRDFNGTLHIIPNGNIVIVSNMCKDYMNAIVEVDVAYKENIDHVISVLNDEMAMAKEEIKALKTCPAVLGIVDLGASGVTLKISAQCTIKENASTERELRLRIKRRLEKENIEIPFPQTTIHMAEK